MASSDRFFMPLEQVFSAAGAVGVGYKLKFWVGGAGAYSVLKDTYSEPTLVTTNANPVVADAAGRFGAIFLGSGDYGVQLLDADSAVIWSQDPVASPSAANATTTVAGIVELATTAEGLIGSSATLVPPVAVVSQMIVQNFNYATASGTANALTGAPAVTPSALANGMVAWVRAASANTGATTLNWASLGVVAVKVLGAAGPVACAGGEIQASNVYRFVYSGTDSAWILENEFAERMSQQTVDDTALGLTLAHAGRTLYHSSATPRTWTIPSNASVPFPIGTVIKIINGPAAGAITLAITTDTLQRGDGFAGTGSRTIAASSVVAIEKVSATVWVISGIFT